MIPKKIHYVWLGKGGQSQLIKNCIASWREKLPDYEIIEWNEDNYDLSKNRFAYQAFKNKLYAYTSDVMRIDVLNRYGGIYLDTDVFVDNSFDDLLDNHAFYGMFYPNLISTAVIGSESNNGFLECILEQYANYDLSMIREGKIPNSNNAIITKLMIDRFPEFLLENKQQRLSDGSVIYPKEFFEVPTYKKYYSTHNLSNSWNHEDYGKLHNLLKKAGPKILGRVLFAKISNYRGYKRYRYLEEYYNSVRK